MAAGGRKTNAMNGNGHKKGDQDPSRVNELLASMNQDQMDHENREAVLNCGGVVGLAHELLVDRSYGLKNDAKELESRAQQYGKNEMPPPPANSWFDLFCDSFDDATLIVLMISAAVSLAVGLYSDPEQVYIKSFLTHLGCALTAARNLSLFAGMD